MQNTYFYAKTFELDVNDGREHNVENIGLFSTRELAMEYIETLGKSPETEGYEFAIIELILVK